MRKVTIVVCTIIVGNLLMGASCNNIEPVNCGKMKTNVDRVCAAGPSQICTASQLAYSAAGCGEYAPVDPCLNKEPKCTVQSPFDCWEKKNDNCVFIPKPACPVCPAGQSCTDPAVGCVPDTPTTPPPSVPLINDEELTKVGDAGAPGVGTAQTWGATSAAIDRWRSKNPNKWRADGACLTSPSLIDEAFLGISTELLPVVAGQSIDKDGARSDCIFVNRSGTDTYEEMHIFEYARGCVATGPGAFKVLYRRVETPPPGDNSKCTDPIPPKVDMFKMKAHGRVNDTTPQFYNRTATRWDGSIVEGYCDQIGMSRLHCPARSECPGVKCEERVACEALGVGGVPGGKPLWRSDGSVSLTDNPYQATCSGCTWLEICAADGTSCSKYKIDQTTGLCKMNAVTGSCEGAE